MRDINDLNHEYISENAYRLKKVYEVGSTTYLGRVKTEDWMIRKIVVNGSETEFSDATRHNNSYTSFDDAWTNKLTLTYE